MEAIFEGLLTLMGLLLELLVTIYLALLEVTVQILGLLVGWICAPFWSDDRRKAGLDPWKIVIRRTAVMILTTGLIITLWWCWSAFAEPDVKPTPEPHQIVK